MATNTTIRISNNSPMQLQTHESLIAVRVMLDPHGPSVKAYGLYGCALASQSLMSQRSCQRGVFSSKIKTLS